MSKDIAWLIWNLATDENATIKRMRLEIDHLKKREERLQRLEAKLELGIGWAAVLCSNKECHTADLWLKCDDCKEVECKDCVEKAKMSWFVCDSCDYAVHCACTWKEEFFNCPACLTSGMLVTLKSTYWEAKKCSEKVFT